jgi:hypothetical protein
MDTYNDHLLFEDNNKTMISQILYLYCDGVSMFAVVDNLNKQRSLNLYLYLYLFSSISITS